MASIVGLVLLLVLLVAVWDSVEIVPEHETRALTVLGQYQTLLEPGINVVPPFVSITHLIDTRTKTIEVPQQQARTTDGSAVTVAAVVECTVVDAEKGFLEAEDHERAVKNISQVTVRAVIGKMDHNSVISHYGRIDRRFRQELDEVTDEWGVRVENAETHEVNAQ